jgi:hypothetical protein
MNVACLGFHDNQESSFTSCNSAYILSPEKNILSVILLIYMFVCIVNSDLFLPHLIILRFKCGGMA